MNKTIAWIAIALILVAGSVQAAAIHNVSLSPVESSNISGMATTIVGDIGGSNPYHNVEINARMNSLPPANMVYQAWLIDSANNTRTSLGAFNGINLNVRQQAVAFSDAGPYTALAVSLEPANNPSTLPTKVVAMGDLPGTVITAADLPSMAVLPADEAFQRQLVMQRYNLTSTQVNDLRARGWGYDTITAAANIGMLSNKSPMDISNMLASGMTWDQIAASQNMTLASALTPAPSIAVAGTTQQYGTSGRTIMPLMFYQRYANGKPIVTKDTWAYWSMRGYSDRDIAVAANIAARTGEDIGDLLMMTKIQGNTWRTIAMDRGISYKDATNTSGWPFGMMNNNMPATTEPSMEPSAAPTAPYSAPSSSY